jgi:hypothetical protein
MQGLKHKLNYRFEKHIERCEVLMPGMGAVYWSKGQCVAAAAPPVSGIAGLHQRSYD